MAELETLSINSDMPDILETVIGQGTAFKGDINTDKSVRIEGDFDGSIESSSKVFIGKAGKMTGSVKCSEMTVEGDIDCSVNCSELFTLATTGKFKGEVSAKNVSILPGCEFDGQLKVKKE